MYFLLYELLLQYLLVHKPVEWLQRDIHWWLLVNTFFLCCRAAENDRENSKLSIRREQGYAAGLGLHYFGQGMQIIHYYKYYSPCINSPS
jgi:hypothetical protein